MFEKSQKPHIQKYLFPENTENKKVKPLRRVISSEGADDRFSESGTDLVLDFDGVNGFFVDDKKVSVREFLDILGVRRGTLYSQRPELKEIFEKELYYENLRKKTKEEINEDENEKMQQALNKE